MKKMILIAIASFVGISLFFHGQEAADAAVLTVNKDGTGDFTTITDAMASVYQYDTIEVYPGTYYESVTFSFDDLTLRGVADVATASGETGRPVVSSGAGTVISCNGRHHCVTQNLVLDGEGTSNGWDPYGFDADHRNNVLEDCEVRNVGHGTAHTGGGNFGGIVMRNVVFHDLRYSAIWWQYLGYNSEGTHGVIMENILVYDLNLSGQNWQHPINIYDLWGADTPITMKNITVYGPDDDSLQYSLIVIDDKCDLDMRAIVAFGGTYANGGHAAIKVHDHNREHVTYSNIEIWMDGGYGTGCIQLNPLFVDVENDDYHLQSTLGSWHDGEWSADAHDSPCIDAGDPADAYGNEPRPNGGRINMGAFGNTIEASMGPAPSCGVTGRSTNSAQVIWAVLMLLSIFFVRFSGAGLRRE